MVNVGKNTSVAIGDHFESFIQSQIENGRYASASEVIRAGLRLLESEEDKLRALRAALLEGERSGLVEDFDLEQFKERMRLKVKS